MNDREEAAALCEQYANQNDAASHGWGNSSGGKVYERNAVLFRLAATALRQTGEGVERPRMLGTPAPATMPLAHQVLQALKVPTARDIKGERVFTAADQLAVADLLATLRPTPPEVTGECAWTAPDDDGIYSTGCGREWVFTEGSPQDNDVKFCMGCGKPVAFTAALAGGK